MWSVWPLLYTISTGIEAAKSAPTQPRLGGHAGVRLRLYYPGLGTDSGLLFRNLI